MAEIPAEPVKLEQRVPWGFAHHGVNHPDGISDILHPHHVPEHHRRVVRSALEDDAGRVDQCDFRIELHLLQGLCDAGPTAHLHGTMSLHRIDDRAFASVRVADDADGEVALGLTGASHPGVIFEQLHELIPAYHGVRALQEPVGSVGRAGHRVGRPLRPAMGRLEGQHGEGPLQVLRPSLDRVLRDQVDLVHQQHQPLASARDLPLEIDISARHRISRIEHLDDHIRRREHFPELGVELPPRVLRFAPRIQPAVRLARAVLGLCLLQIVGELAPALVGLRLQRA
mmetsp:Transcript_67616/g.207114  ORF Transcript_67616/g.207114 Transcript_67616/m.207114 type:complete len:285 (+) Transcript_67616:326-1180(+)